MYLLKVVKDEETSSVLCGVDVVLVVNAGVPKRLDLSLLPRFGLSHDQWVIFVEGCVVLVERGRYPWLVLEGRIRKYEAGDFSSFRASKTNQETCLQEEFSNSLEVVVLRLANNWGEGLDGGFESGGDVG